MQFTFFIAMQINSIRFNTAREIACLGLIKYRWSSNFLNNFLLNHRSATNRILKIRTLTLLEFANTQSTAS